MNVTNRPAQVIFIHHGKSERNKAKPQGVTYFANEDARRAIKGIPDHKIPLTSEGFIQSEETGLYLRKRFGTPDYLYHSGYLRSEQSMLEIIKAFSRREVGKIRIQINQFIRPRDSGYTYDMTKEEAAAAFPWFQEHWNTFGGFFGRPPGGESFCDVSQRIQTFLNTLYSDTVGKKVWVITHAGPLRAVRFILEKWTYDQAAKWPEGQFPKDCGITLYEFDKLKQELTLREYNTVGWQQS